MGNTAQVRPVRISIKYLLAASALVLAAAFFFSVSAARAQAASPDIDIQLGDAQTSHPNHPGDCTKLVSGWGKEVTNPDHGDIDCMQVRLNNPGTYDEDFQLCLFANAASSCTPWASEGGGFGPVAIGGNSINYAAMVVNTRAAPAGMTFDTVSVGVQLAYRSNGGACGPSSGMVTSSGNPSAWAYGAVNDDDPGCARSYLSVHVIKAPDAWFISEDCPPQMDPNTSANCQIIMQNKGIEWISDDQPVAQQGDCSNFSPDTAGQTCTETKSYSSSSYKLVRVDNPAVTGITAPASLAYRRDVTLTYTSYEYNWCELNSPPEPGDGGGGILPLLNFVNRWVKIALRQIVPQVFAQAPETCTSAINVNVTNSGTKDIFYDQQTGFPYSAPASSQIPFTVASGSQTGSYTLVYQMQGPTGLFGQVAPVPITVASGPDFSCTLGNMQTQSVDPGVAAHYIVSASSISNFSGTVNLSIPSGLPAGAAGSGSVDVPAGGSNSTTVTVTTSASTPPGTYVLDFSGSASPGSHDCGISNLVVNPPAASTVSGRAYNSTTNQGFAGKTVETCTGTNYTTDANGNFSFQLPKDGLFCLRIGAIAGYDGPATVPVCDFPGGNSYEWQVAGEAYCHNYLPGNPIPAHPIWSWDKDTDNGFDFIYSPTPVYSYTVTPADLGFAAQQNSSPNPPAQSVTVTNTGNQPLTVSASKGSTWLDISSGSMPLNPGQQAVLNAQPNATNLGAQLWTDTIAFSTASAGNKQVNVTYNITAVPSPVADLKCSASGAAGSFSDGPCSVIKGNPVHLSWTSSNVTSCVVNPGGWTGTSNPDQPTGALNSSQTYTASCSGPNGPISDSVDVAVVIPDFSFTCPGTQSVNYGQTATYAVSATPQNGYYGTITVTTSVSPSGPTAPNVVLNPANFYANTVPVSTGSSPAQTYSVTFTASDGVLPPKSCNSQLVIQAGGPSPTVGFQCSANNSNFSAGPCQVTTGSSGYLEWTSQNASACSMNKTLLNYNSAAPSPPAPSGDTTVPLNMASGTPTNTLNSSATFKITCTGNGLSDSKTVDFTVGAGSGNLSSSRKNVVSVSSGGVVTNFNPPSCQSPPPGSALGNYLFKDKDIVTFVIQVCNTGNADLDMSGVTLNITDTPSNLVKPPGGWNVHYSCGSGCEEENGNDKNYVDDSGFASSGVIKFRFIGKPSNAQNHKIPAGNGVWSLTVDGMLKAPADPAIKPPYRFYNAATLSFNPPNPGIAVPPLGLPYPYLFVSTAPNPPDRHEIAP